MAFIRAYAEAGDPFRFRLPKFIRKAARAVGKVAKFATPVAAFVPGLGIPALAAGIAARAGKVGGLARAARKGAAFVRQVRTPDTAPGVDEEEAVTEVPDIQQQIQPYLPEPEPEILEPEPEPDQEEEEEPVDYLAALRYARAYGFEGDPGPSRRKAAGAGPKQKAKTKANARAAKATGMKRTGPEKRRPRQKPRQSLVFGANPKINLHNLLKKGASLAGREDVAGLLEQAHLKDFGGGGKAARIGGGHRRRINPTNIKALRHSASRLVQFEKTVHRVRKSLRGLGSAIAPQHRCPPGRKGRK